MFNTVTENLSQIQEDIVPYKPNIIAITKYFDVDAIIAAYEAGLRNFGESRVLEAIDKINRLPEEIKKNSTFHFIGHLQGNKAKKAVKYFDYIHSVDSFKLASTISQEAKEENKVQKIFLQLNIAEEVQKFGYSKSDLVEEFPKIQELSNIKIVGLMSMAPLGAEENELRQLFTDVAKTKSELEKIYNCKLDELSMGMSQDYKIAAQCGATMLRIGRKLFR
ncbi:MAG: YggS family pyridoxal phosphate-dependent enzyme [Brachyspira sp.]|nr:YggS family pyridoxal phosphate-dependent enzyme [Brachyspira sp.]